MKIIVSGRNIELTPAIKDHVTDQFRKLFEHFDFLQEVHVFLSVEKNPSIRANHLAEATVHIHGAIIRVSVATENLYSSIDQLEKKAFRSLGKQKNKLLKRSKHDASGESIRKQAIEEDTHLEDDDDLHEEVFTTYQEVPATVS